MLKKLRLALAATVLSFSFLLLATICIFIPLYFVLYTQELVNLNNYNIILPVRLILLILVLLGCLFLLLKNFKPILTTKPVNFRDGVAAIWATLLPIFLILFILGHLYSVNQNYNKYGYGAAEAQLICRKYESSEALIGNNRINFIDVIDSTQNPRTLYISEYNFQRLLIPARNGDCAKPYSPIYYDKLFGYVLDFEV